jgi:hypothetical protein
MSYPTDEERKKKVETSERTRTGEERFGRRTEVILMKGLGWHTQEATERHESTAVMRQNENEKESRRVRLVDASLVRVSHEWRRLSAYKTTTRQFLSTSSGTAIDAEVDWG